MERFLPLLLQVWRHASRHAQLEETLAAVLPVLRRRLPVEQIRVLGLDPERMGLEQVAAAPNSSNGDTNRRCSPEEWAGLLAWCGAGNLYRGAALGLNDRFPSLALSAGRGLLAGGLQEEGNALGLLLLEHVADGFEAIHESMAAALLDPLGVALANDRRLRLLSAQREAAEADRQSILVRLGRQDIADTLIGAQGGLRDVMQRVELVARSDAPVLILGETGTGKEVVGRAVHKGSPRANGPFLRVNCGAIAPELIDSELFGHERGSFTGATSQRRGWFERADRGTLFLDEIGELSPSVQVRLLRILQDGTFQRLGGQHQLRVDVRIVAATNRDLLDMVRRGVFREDLWYRIAVFPIRLPALRERPEDIPALAAHFAKRAALRLGLPACVPARQDIAGLLAYPWPGNVRELASVMERAAILGDGKGLELAQALGVGMGATSPVFAESQGESPALAESLTLDEAMANHIRQALVRTLGRVEGPYGAARQLGINPHTLRARMRKLGIDWRRYRAREETREAQRD